METNDWDHFEEIIATRVLIEEYSLADAVGEVCRQHPTRDASSLLLAAISFVTHFDQDAIFVELQAHETSIDLYRLIAIIAADVALLPLKSRTCGDLQKFWMKSNSDVFR